MKKLLSAFGIAFCLVAFAIPSHAQVSLKVLSYNVLNYPNPDYDDRRADTLRKIVDHLTPDIFLIQELKSAAGLQELLDVAFNHSGETAFSAGTWVSQVSNPNSSWKLQQNLIYNTEKLTLIDESYLLTLHRDLNVFKFLVNDSNLEIHGDTTFLYAFSIHLKSSQGTANEQSRLAMVEVLSDYLSTLPADAVVLVAGDFNVYTSTEPAYQLLINPNNDLVLKDPVNVPGSWHNNAQFSDVHTQSTRTTPINNDGAGGGMDDRFDFILISEPGFDGSTNTQYVDGSYVNVGNSGNCFNQRLIDCTGGDVPDDVVYALYQMSDHLPIALEMQVTLPEPMSAPALLGYSERLYGANVVQNSLEVKTKDEKTIQGTYHIIDYQGQKVLGGIASSGQSLEISTTTLVRGMYLLISEDQHWKPFRFVKQ